MFQSLIGTIKTSVFSNKLAEAKVFQSLIGTIKTIHQVFLACRNLLFQSLIGTIKTFEFLNDLIEEIVVSIPHRYDKNAIQHVHFVFALRCFNPS